MRCGVHGVELWGRGAQRATLPRKSVLRAVALDPRSPGTELGATVTAGVLLHARVVKAEVDGVPGEPFRAIETGHVVDAEARPGFRQQCTHRLNAPGGITELEDVREVARQQ